MASFFERYCSGECERVWVELGQLGDGVRRAPVEADAQAVARETMRRALANIELLVPRLKRIGYQFGTLGGENSGQWYGDSRPLHEPPAADAPRVLEDLEARYGPLCLSLRAWYEVVGGVNFLGFHPRWPDPQLLDPLCIMPLEIVMSELEETDEDCAEEDRPQGIPVSPDDYHKADVSGGSSYAVEFPSRCADARFLNEWHDTTFVDYLRKVFRWAGFPGMERCPVEQRPAKQLSALVQELQPL
jgi:hypothetical protein